MVLISPVVLEVWYISPSYLRDVWLASHPQSFVREPFVPQDVFLFMSKLLGLKDRVARWSRLRKHRHGTSGSHHSNHLTTLWALFCNAVTLR